MKIASEAMILEQKNFEVGFGNYFAEKMKWEVGAVAVHVASENWMQQIVDGAGVAAAAVNADDIASLLHSEMHRLDVGCSRHGSLLEDEDDEDC